MEQLDYAQSCPTCGLWSHPSGWKALDPLHRIIEERDGEIERLEAELKEEKRMDENLNALKGHLKQVLNAFQPQSRTPEQELKIVKQALDEAMDKYQEADAVRKRMGQELIDMFTALRERDEEIASLKCDLARCEQQRELLADAQSERENYDLSLPSKPDSHRDKGTLFHRPKAFPF